MNLRGKTREQLATVLAYKSRSELIDLIHSLVTVEILTQFQPAIPISGPLEEMEAKKDRFSRQKNSPYTAATEFLLRWRNTCRNGRTVTTKQLFLPHQRRRALCALPNWLRNLH